MTSIALSEIESLLDATLHTDQIPDYSGALNGVQFDNSGRVSAIAASVDFSTRTIQGAVSAGCNLMLVHHGMYWGGLQPLRGWRRERLRLLLEHDVAVYASHLPLDAHPELGNNALLAKELGLVPSGSFAEYSGVSIGVSGETEVDTASLLSRLDAFAQARGGQAIASRFPSSHLTKRWAICSGAGADSDSLRAAYASGIDTLIVGEGPHHTAVEAEEYGIVVVYAGHYATETLGVSALAALVARRFDIPWQFVDAPTGL